jgi:hypothetical protein
MHIGDSCGDNVPLALNVGLTFLLEKKKTLLNQQQKIPQSVYLSPDAF